MNPDGDLQSLANELSSMEGVRSGFIVDRTGAPVAGIVTGEDEQILGSLTGAIFATINRAMQRTGLGELGDIIVSASNGSLQAMAAGDVVLVVLANEDTNVGLVRMEMRRIASFLASGPVTVRV